MLTDTTTATLKLILECIPTGAVDDADGHVGGLLLKPGIHLHTHTHRERENERERLVLNHVWYERETHTSVKPCMV